MNTCRTNKPRLIHRALALALSLALAACLAACGEKAAHDAETVQKALEDFYGIPFALQSEAELGQDNFQYVFLDPEGRLFTVQSVLKRITSAGLPPRNTAIIQGDYYRLLLDENLSAFIQAAQERNLSFQIPRESAFQTFNIEFARFEDLDNAVALAADCLAIQGPLPKRKYAQDYVGAPALPGISLYMLDNGGDSCQLANHTFYTTRGVFNRARFEEGLRQECLQKLAALVERGADIDLPPWVLEEHGQAPESAFVATSSSSEVGSFGVSGESA